MSGGLIICLHVKLSEFLNFIDHNGAGARSTNGPKRSSNCLNSIIGP